MRDLGERAGRFVRDGSAGADVWEVTRPTVAEVLERAAARSEKTSVSSADLVRQARAERGEEVVRRARG